MVYPAPDTNHTPSTMAGQLLTNPDDINLITDIVDGCVQERLKPIHAKLDGLEKDHAGLVERVDNLTKHVDEGFKALHDKIDSLNFLKLGDRG